jgi:hypothetical protein
MLAMRLIQAEWTGLLSLCIALLTGVAHAAPVPVTDIITTPGFAPGIIETNAQTLTYLKTTAGWYAPTGATCTYCPAGSAGGAPDEIPTASRTSALSGLKFTQGVLNFTSTGAKFDLGVTVTNDSVGIVLGELGTAQQHAGDPVTVYPTTNGVRVGAWARELGAGDYGEINKSWRFCYSTTQDLHCFLTTFRLSDFTNGTGELLFDGIELADNTGYDPNLVATIGELAQLYQPEVSRVLPVTALTFLPGFDTNPETDGQALTGITTDEGSFLNVTGLICTAVSSQQAIAQAINEPAPASAVEALSGLRFTQFAVNPANVDWSLGRTVSQTDTRVRFFFGEVALESQNAGDPVTIWPLSGGQRVGDWALSITNASYGSATSPIWHSTFSGYKFKGYLVSFALTDFTGGLADTLVSVDGFRVACGLNADPNIFGMYEIPPPPPLGTLIRIQ